MYHVVAYGSDERPDIDEIMDCVLEGLSWKYPFVHVRRLTPIVLADG
jgi:hypothetical protein